MTQTAITREPVAGRRLKAERLNGARALREAQALRYRVFSAEFDAKLEGAEDGLDRDDYDRHCAHIGVRDLDSGALVATTRLLDHRAAERLGRFYSEEEFHLSGLDALHGPVLEIGRTCVAPEYRNGATIAVLWGELAEVLNEGGYRYLMGCASIPMRDGGMQAKAVMQRLRERYLCTDYLQAEPKNPLPPLDVPENLTAELPPLLRPTCAWAPRSAASLAGTRISRSPTCSSCSSATNSARATPATSRQRSDGAAAPAAAQRTPARAGRARTGPGRLGQPARAAARRRRHAAAPAPDPLVAGAPLRGPCPSRSGSAAKRPGNPCCG